jgi:hypothetical protein
MKTVSIDEGKPEEAISWCLQAARLIDGIVLKILAFLEGKD